MSNDGLSSSRQAAVRSLENGFLANKDLATSVINGMQTGNKELSAAIKELGIDTGVAKSDINRLALLQDLIELTNSEWEVLGVIVKDAAVTSLHYVASTYFDKEKWPELDGASLSRFQDSLFRSQPLGVIAGFIKSAKLVVDADIKEEVCTVLTSFAASGASFRDQRLAEHFQLLSRDKEGANDKIPELLKAIQRLLAIIVSPLDVVQLIKANFTSAQSIAATSVGRFNVLLRAQGMTADRGTVIHNAATKTEYRNEEAWISLLKSRQQDFVPLPTVDVPTTLPRPGTGKQLYNMTNMFHLEEQQLGEGYSIFGLSAYLVQLLRFLEVSKCLPEAPEKDGEKEDKVPEKNGENKDKALEKDGENKDKAPEKDGEKKDKALSSSLFHKLMARRPDIQKIELSYENDSVLVDYIDLANEIMESYVLYLNTSAEKRTGKDAAQAYNSRPSQSSPDSTQKQLNTNFSVYENKLSRHLYPFQIFPYVHSLESTRNLLSALGTSRREVLRVFRSEPRAMSKSLTTQDYQIYKDRPGVDNWVEQFLDKAEAAEMLNLSHEDFLAITGESFWPSESSHLFLQTPLTAYMEKTNPNFHIASFWGYSASDYSGADAPNLSESERAIKAMTDETAGIGLAFIKDQLLPRSGLDFAQLLALLKTEYIAHRLVIVPMTIRGKDFEGHISDMKLRASPIDQEPGALTTALCEQIHSFVRLYQKLGWDVATLDKALSCLKRNAVAAGLTSVYGGGINPQLLVQLSALKELSEYLGVKVEELLPLWADIDTYGSTSQYASLFLHGDKQRMDAFKPKNGKFLAVNKMLVDYERHLLGAFELSIEDLTTLISAAGLTVRTYATLANVSHIFRLRLLCDMLAVPYGDCEALLRVMRSSYQVFASPKATLKAVTAFRELTKKGWDLQSLDSVQKHHSSSLATAPATEGPAAAVSTISSGVCSVAREMQTSWAVIDFSSGAAMSDAVLDMATKVFGAVLGPKVAQYVNSKSQPPQSGSIGSAINEYLRSQGGKPFEQASSLDGVEIVPSTKPHVWKQTFLELCAVELGVTRLRQAFVDKAKEAFSNIDVSVLDSAVLSAAINLKPGQDGAAASRALMKRFSLFTSPPILDDVLKRSILPIPTTSLYTFYHQAEKLDDGAQDDSNTTPTFTINGLSVPGQKLSPGSHSFGPVSLKAGSEAVLGANFNIKKMEWAAESMGRSKLAANMITVADRIEALSRELMAILTVAQKFKLDKQELEVFSNRDEISKSSEALPSTGYRDLMGLRALQTYVQLRDATNTKTARLIDLLSWMKTPDDHRNVYQRVASMLALPESTLKRLVKAKFDKLSDSEVISKLRDIRQLASLQEMRVFCSKFGLGTDNACLQVLFGMAVPSKPFDQKNSFADAVSMRALLRPVLGQAKLAKYAKHMQASQRSALVSYLLQQKEVRDLGLWDADSLFEYFLIDVQMGPDLQTTRTKQAVSTIQLYVQRCLLGLEQHTGALPEHVSKPQWEWMQRFSIWEANRKLALYPENWLDPMLRDDKTDLFQTFETALLAGNLTMSTLTRGIRDYICSLHDISDLSVQAYLRDIYPPLPPLGSTTKEESLAEATSTASYHFFAATKTSPYEYYYRKMDVTPPYQHVFWSPWSKINVDIVQLDADWDGTALDTTGVYLIPAVRGRRLYLFMPLMMLKTVADGGARGQPEKPTYGQMAEKKIDSSQQPPKTWEIRLAWTELVDGQWLPKRTSPVVLSVQSTTISKVENQLPSVANFHFYVKTRSKGDLEKDFLSIGVGCRYADASYSYLGCFDIKGDIVTVSRLGALCAKHISAKGTKFNKYALNYDKAKNSTDEASEVNYGDQNLLPVLALPAVDEALASNTELSWTLMYDEAERLGDEYRLSGLVYDVKAPGLRPASKFTYLVKGLHEGERGRVTELGVNETFNFPVSSSLKRAIMSSESGKEGATVGNAIAKLSETAPEVLVEVFGQRNGPYHELSSPYALYSWEICVHSVMLAMERLLATQQFELAIKVTHLVFDPTLEGVTSGKCWRFPPFEQLARQSRSSVKDILANMENATSFAALENSLGVSEKLRSTRSVAHAAARGQPAAYMKRIMMKYIEILLASGDEYFRQGSLETLPLAIQRYIEAIHVLGPDPPLRPDIGKRKIRTFQSLNDDMVDMELEFPFSREMVPRSEGHKEEAISPDGFVCTLRTSYFSIPPNPELKRLRGELKVRLYRIRNSLDINGNPIKYSITEPSIDPGKLASLMAAGGGFSAAMDTLLGEANSPMPNYRFTYLLTRAYDMCAELRSFGEQLLAAKEKKDAEGLSMLRARQDTVIQDTTVALRRLQLDEAKRTLKSLERTRKSHETRLSYYLALVGEKTDKVPGPEKEFEELEQTWETMVDDDELRMTISEKVEMLAAETAASINQGASAIDLAASVLIALPNLTENMAPLGMGVSLKFDAGNIAQAMGIVSQVKRLEASMLGDLGVRTARKGQLLKQLQDKRLQANLAGHDIKSVDEQMAAQRVRIEAAEKEIETQLELVKNAREVEQWHKSKFTSEQLYSWMESSARTLYYDAYKLAMDLARRAERALTFENGGAGSSTQSYIRPEGYWEASGSGLLAGQKLMLALKGMEVAYQERRSHDFEISKVVSLRAVDPLALITLRETGTAEFALPETLFDMDFPGHYMRRIKSVGVTIPCVVGPYAGVSAVLTLVKHRYRVDGTATTGGEYVRQRVADGAAFRTDRVPIESIAVSGGSGGESGVFELDFRGERMLPFEGAGLVSSWRIELPSAVRQFDYASMADVVLQVRYTARNGGESLRRAAEESVLSLVKDVKTAGMSALWDVRSEWAAEWHRLVGGGSVELGDLAGRLPYWTRGAKVVVNKVVLVVSPAGGDWKDKVRLSVCGTKGFRQGSVGESTMLESDGLKTELKGGWTLTVGGRVERLLMVVGYTLGDD